MVSLKLLSAREFVRHFILHTIDVFTIDFHFLVHATFKVRNLLQVSFTSINLDLQGGSGAFSLIQLALLEVEILFHLFDLADSGKCRLPVQVFVHVLKQCRDRFLRICHLRLHLLLILLVFLSKFVDLLFLRIEHFKLLLAAHAAICTSRSITHLTLNVLDITVVRVDHLAQVTDFLVLLLDLRIVLLNSIHETLSCFWEGQIVLIALKLKVLLALLQLRLFFTKVLSTLFERVLLELVLSSL